MILISFKGKRLFLNGISFHRLSFLPLDKTFSGLKSIFYRLSWCLMIDHPLPFGFLYFFRSVMVLISSSESSDDPFPLFLASPLPPDFAIFLFFPFFLLGGFVWLNSEIFQTFTLWSSAPISLLTSHYPKQSNSNANFSSINAQDQEPDKEDVTSNNCFLFMV